MPRISRKYNPDYEKATSASGKTVYRKKKMPEKPTEKKPKTKKTPVEKKEKKEPPKKKEKKPTDATVKKAPKKRAKSLPPAPSGSMPTDQNKPVVSASPAVGVAQAQADLSMSVAEGLSQKELNSINRVKARVARVKASQK